MSLDDLRPEHFDVPIECLKIQGLKTNTVDHYGRPLIHWRVAFNWRHHGLWVPASVTFDAVRVDGDPDNTCTIELVRRSKTV